ncbi:krueppel target at 95d isoform a [Anaeramoeba flamelloides]|uniref:Krueppel target at 95d isoform a n=1 Tax=Anaeramoeba flamelloides TaxID=1746091 RepID=A0AAV7YHY5_9EUKA|nr:krueppel target at 95d isoform a [Anaeramoeba flamelloides]
MSIESSKYFSSLKKKDLRDISSTFVARTCQVIITKLELSKKIVLKPSRRLQLCVEISGNRHGLSHPILFDVGEEIETKNNARGFYSLPRKATKKQNPKIKRKFIFDLNLTFQYLHKIKSTNQYLIFKLKIKKKRTQKGTIIGYGRLNLYKILQQKYDDILLLQKKERECVCKINLSVETIPLNLKEIIYENEDRESTDTEEELERDQAEQHELAMLFQNKNINNEQNSEFISNINKKKAKISLRKSKSPQIGMGNHNIKSDEENSKYEDPPDLIKSTGNINNDFSLVKPTLFYREGVGLGGGSELGDKNTNTNTNNNKNKSNNSNKNSNNNNDDNNTNEIFDQNSTYDEEHLKKKKQKFKKFTKKLKFRKISKNVKGSEIGNNNQVNNSGLDMKNQDNNDGVQYKGGLFNMNEMLDDYSEDEESELGSKFNQGNENFENEQKEKKHKITQSTKKIDQNNNKKSHQNTDSNTNNNAQYYLTNYNEKKEVEIKKKSKKSHKAENRNMQKKEKNKNNMINNDNDDNNTNSNSNSKNDNNFNEHYHHNYNNGNKNKEDRKIEDHDEEMIEHKHKLKQKQKFLSTLNLIKKQKFKLKHKKKKKNVNDSQSQTSNIANNNNNNNFDKEIHHKNKNLNENEKFNNNENQNKKFNQEKFAVDCEKADNNNNNTQKLAEKNINKETETETLTLNFSKIINSIFLANKSPLIMFVDKSKKKTKKLIALNEIEYFKKTILLVSNFTEISVLMNLIMKKLRQKRLKSIETCKIVIAGQDTYVSKILRAYVEHLAKGPKSLDLIKFYLLPICKRADLALHIASEDEQYYSLFIRSGWKDLFNSNSNFNQEELEKVCDIIKKYLENAKQVTNLKICELYCTIKKDSNNSVLTQKSIPFLKLVYVGEMTLNNYEEKLEYLDTVVEYWKEGKKIEGKRITHKTKLIFFGATPLPTIASAMKIEGPNRPIPGESFGVSISALKKKKNKLKGNSMKTKVLKSSHIVVKTLSKKKTFTVVIDSVKWQRVQLISLRPKWPSKANVFPVACFLSKNN